MEVKQSIEVATGLSQDALHIYLALFIQMLVAAVSRRGLGHFLPWLCVLLLELANEWVDLRSTEMTTEVGKWASIHDLWNTMLVPTLLLLIGRFAPWLLQRPPSADRGETGAE